MIHIEVLGPLVTRYRATTLTLQPMQDVVILALWSAGTTITPSRLAELIWDVPTAGATKTVQGHIRRIRGALLAAGGTAAEFISTVRLGGGVCAYELARELRVDADEFTDAVSAGQRAYREQRFEQAASRVAAARKLWRGEPLADARNRPFALPKILRLDHANKEALIIQQKTAICLGTHREAIGELYPLTVSYPHELELWAALGIALYRCRRLSEASEVFRQALDTLRKAGLGDESPHFLLDLQREILSGAYPMSGPLGF